MADFNVNQDSGDGFSVPVDGIGKVAVLKRTVDFTVAANQLAQNGVMAIFALPAGVKTREFGMKAKTADTDVTSVHLGVFTRVAATSTITAVDADGFGVGVTLASAGHVGMDVDAAYNPQGTGGRGYVGTSDYYLAITNNDADTINEAVVDFYAIVEDLR